MAAAEHAEILRAHAAAGRARRMCTRSGTHARPVFASHQQLSALEDEPVRGLAQRFGRGDQGDERVGHGAAFDAERWRCARSRRRRDRASGLQRS